MVDAVAREQPLRELDQPTDPIRLSHFERVDLVGGDPDRIRVHRLGGQLDRLPAQDPADPRGGDGLLGQPGRPVGAAVDAGREPPGALVQHPDGQPQILAVAARIELSVAYVEGRVADPFEPEVGLLGAQLGRAAQGGVSQRSGRQLQEGRVDTHHLINLSR